MTPLAFDIAIGIFLLILTLVSYFRGIIREFFLIASFAIAALASWAVGSVLQPAADKWLKVESHGKEEKILSVIDYATASKALSFGGVFLLSFIIVSIVGILISKTIKESGLTIVDRLLGAVYGLARGFLIVVLIYSLAMYKLKGDEDKLVPWVKEAKTFPLISASHKWLVEELDKVDLEKIFSDAKELKDEVKEKADKEIKKDEQQAQPAPAPAPVAPTPAPTPAPQAMPAPTLPGSAPAPAPAPAPVAPTPAPAQQQGSAAPAPGTTTSTTTDGVTTTTTTPAGH